MANRLAGMIDAHSANVCHHKSFQSSRDGTQLAGEARA
jgi:hypothetical protein